MGKSRAKGSTVKRHGSVHGARHSAARVEEAEETVKELRAVPMGAGIALPTPGGGPVAGAGEAPRPPAEPGRCSVRTPARLAAVPR
ncbi:hypothetical protein GCM10010358_01470 [Streptomyces minutiscleroticus]|uniref:Uncharacterized protein n=1 Tax=Streptomyces minutiscleroticus TaxID=68238 RepID=A0A918K6V5_9ACTN|nr:hypothetical protein GCM10010358_01470 [Streptomyces minutiscleroticus]